MKLLLPIVAALAVLPSGTAVALPMRAVETAKTLSPGKLELAVGAGLVLGEGQGSYRGELGALPLIEGGASYGLAPQLDVGLRVSPVGTMAHAKFQLLRGGNASGFEIALAPALGVFEESGEARSYLYGASDPVAFKARMTGIRVDLPLILGDRWEGLEVMIAPFASLEYYTASSVDESQTNGAPIAMAPFALWYAGAMGGFVVPLGARAALVPTFAIAAALNSVDSLLAVQIDKPQVIRAPMRVEFDLRLRFVL